MCIMSFSIKHIKFFVISLLLWLSGSFYAQKNIPDYDFTVTSHPWLTSKNAAGLKSFKAGKMSIATINSHKSNGGFINYYESDNSYDANVLTETYYALNDKVSVYGKVNYAYFKGQNMGGSVFVSPYDNAFNIVEYADSTAGTKIKESYAIIGGISTQLTDALLLGGRVDYQNVSYFKTKDLRHTNDLLNLKTYLGLIYQFKRFDVGANYYYHRRVESIEFASFGNTDQQFYSLIDYGGFFGYGENYESLSRGISRGSSVKPYFNQENGLSVQWVFSKHRSTSFFNELSITKGAGYYGRQGTSTAVYTEHSSNSYAYLGKVSITKPSSFHQLALAASHTDRENTLNDVNTYTDDLQGTIIVYGVSQKISNKHRTQLKLDYTGYFGLEQGQARWQINAQTAYTSKSLRSIYYEQLSYRDQEINQLKTEIAAHKNIYSDRNAYRITLGLGYTTGSGYAFKDTYFTADQGDLVHLDRYAYREFEYFTAERINTQIGFRYSRLIKQNKAKIYGEINYFSIKAFDTEYIGDYWGNAEINLGYQF